MPVSTLEWDKKLIERGVLPAMKAFDATTFIRKDGFIISEF